MTIAAHALRGLAGSAGVGMFPGMQSDLMPGGGDMSQATGGALFGFAGVALVGSAISGAILGGLSGASWQSAGQGALFATGASGLAQGIGLGMIGAASGIGMGAGIFAGVIGLTCLGLGAYRFTKMRKGPIKGFLSGTGKRRRSRKGR
jgi:hypothetical protein